MRRSSILLAAVLLALLWSGAALAQAPGGYDCEVLVGADGAFDARCVPQATVTSTPTSMSTATRTPAPTATATATATPVVVLPTYTATATPAPTSAPASALRLNVPLMDVAPGDPALDANNWAIAWLGDISPDGGYVQVRLVGTATHLIAYIQAMNPDAAGTVNLALNGRTLPVTYRNTPGWEFGERCGAGPGSCRGWSAYREIPWAELGGRPAEGAIWPLSLSAYGDAWAGSLHWGLPDYGGRTAAGARLLTAPLSQDATLGGSTECGDGFAWPDYFPLWGSHNYEDGSKFQTFMNVQSQWDTADWPCYSRYIAKWSVASIPPDAQVVSATVSMWRFGHSGYGPGDTGTTVYQVYEVPATWGETTVTWDNAPIPLEDISRTPTHECGGMDETPPGGCGKWYSFDVTEIVRRAQARGDGEAAMLLYTAAGQYHAGKYFYTSEGAVTPVVRIAYTTEGTATWTPTATATSVASASPTPTPTATSAPATSSPAATWTSTPNPSTTPLPTSTATAPSPSATPRQTATVTPSPTLTPRPSSTPPAPAGNTYYLSPAGNDGASGASTATAWKTFARAWQSLQPGDTLLVMDGTYAESIQPNVRNGQAGRPITVRALNDGKVVIDGQGQRRPVQLGDTWGPNGGPIGDWYTVEGVVARNGTDAVVHVRGSNNTLRRVSAYDANPDLNSTVFLLWGNNNLVEDAVAAGTGRYMFEVYQGNGNTFRRVFAQWERWDGRQFCGVQWPHGYNVGVYNASNTTIENAIAYGRAPAVGVLVQANGDGTVANNNAVLGSMALMSGRDRDGSVWTYGTGLAQPTTRPLPSSCPDNVTQWSWGGQRVGFALTGQGTMQNNVYRDVLAVNNMGIGFVTGKPYGIGDSNTTLDHATLTGNGDGAEFWERAQGGNILIGTPGLEAVTNSIVSGSSWPMGEGARFQYRYVDRALTDTPLLPWPMEGRVQAELGVSVGAVIQQYAGEAGQ